MKTLSKNDNAAKPAAKPAAKAVKSASPLAGRRNFRLSGLEILIVVLIVLGVAYLVTMWVSTALSPEPEAAAPAAPGTLMEKALVASEKAQAQLASLSRDIGALRKDMDALQARRNTTAPAGPGQPQHAPTSSGLERRLEDVERQLQALAGSKDDKALATALQEIKALTGRLDKLEKDLAGKGQAKGQDKSQDKGQDKSQDKSQDKKAADNHPAAVAVDPQLLARLEHLEQAQAQDSKEAAPDLAGLENRLAKLEQGLKQTAREAAAASVAPAPPAAPKPAVQAPPTAPRAAAPKPVDTRKVSYRVKSGDTILGLARKYKVSLDDIVRWNAQQLGDRRNLLIGESLVIIPGNNS